MSAVPHVVGVAASPARCREPEAPPDVELTLPADRRAAFRARGEIHRLQRDVHPRRRAVAARLVGALLETGLTTTPQPTELRLWRSPSLLAVQVRSTTRLRVTGESRLLLDRLADRWELDRAGHTMRFEVRTRMSSQSTA